MKGRVTSSKNRKFFVAVMKGALGIVKKMLTNGRFVKLLWACVVLARAERLWQLAEAGGLVMDLGTCLIRSSSR